MVITEKQLCDIYLDYLANFKSESEYASHYNLLDSLCIHLISHAFDIYKISQEKKVKALNIHRRINKRMSSIIRQYNDSLKFEGNFERRREKFRLAKALTYGGFRNTCYDIRPLFI